MAEKYWLERAAGFAAWKHAGQFRKGEAKTPYIHHPVEVAALLHDVIEDTETESAEINTHFGSRVCSIVLEVTDDTSLKRQDRKAAQIAHAPHLSSDAQRLKLADKISNVHGNESGRRISRLQCRTRSIVR
jgi:guanosine-3',5'-bis(diphosphate) 3'-pyrophosphohydrolase